MKTSVHFEPDDTNLNWKLHAWAGNRNWDLEGTSGHGALKFVLPECPDLRELRLKFRSIHPGTNAEVWERDDFVRTPRLVAPADLWLFSQSGRVLYQKPYPATPAFQVKDVLTLRAITRNRYRGGRLYVWNPYFSAEAKLWISESSRDEAGGVSTFSVVLQSWMVRGFHFKLTRRNDDNTENWEPDFVNRVWRPVDGANVWFKAGQVDVRSKPLALREMPIEVSYSARVHPPSLELEDPLDDFKVTLNASSTAVSAETPLFRVGRYTARIYPGAGAYTLKSLADTALVRPFPADPENLHGVSKFTDGAEGWKSPLPATTRPTKILIQPGAHGTFGDGINVDLSAGEAGIYFSAAATPGPSGEYEVTVDALEGITTSVLLNPVKGQEARSYAWIDVARYLPPEAVGKTVYTTEGVFGLTTRARTAIADPPSRRALMEAAFGTSAVASGVFAPEEMPHGATVSGDRTWFVIHAPHAVTASLILVDEPAAGGPKRRTVPMMLTDDRRYWWCEVPSTTAPPGARYRFLLNDSTEIIDPAAREVRDREEWDTSPQDDPADEKKTWSIVLDVPFVRAAVRQSA